MFINAYRCFVLDVLFAGEEAWQEGTLVAQGQGEVTFAVSVVDIP